MRYLIFIFCLLSLESFGQIRDYNIVVNPLSKDDPYILSSDTSGTYRGRAQFHTIQYTANLLKPYLGCIDTAFVRNDSLFIYTTDHDSISFAGGGGITDGDKGDITVSGSGSNWQIDALAVDDNELQLTGVVAGQYNYPAVLKVNSKGRVTEVVAGSAPLDTFSYLATQSDISGFLSAVSHDNTLTGNGTVATPLKVDSSKIATQYDLNSYLLKSNNLSDVSDVGSARGNLGLGSLAILSGLTIDEVLGYGSHELTAARFIDVTALNYPFTIEKETKKLLNIDWGNSLFEIGDIGSLGNGTHLTINDATQLSHLTNNGNTAFFGINRTDPGQALDVIGNGLFSGTLTASNLSGTNTGDQTFTNSSDATSHTVTLSASGGSVQLVEGSNITLTTTGTAGDGVVTIASTASGYTDEQAQDAVGGMVNTSLTYVDATPSLAVTSRTINGVAFDHTANISVPASGKTFTWDGNGGIPATGSTIYWIVPTACTISGWSIWATGASPTCTIDVWRVATGTTLPVVGNSIMGTKPALSTGNAVRSTTLTGWNPVAFAAGDIIGVNLDAVTVSTFLSFQLEFN